MVCASIVIALSGAAVTSGQAKWHARPKAKVTKPQPTRTSVAGNTIITPGADVALALGRGEQINLGEPISDVFTSNPGAVDINVRSVNQIYLFGKERGTASVYATNKNGRIIYSANVRVEQNIDTLDQMLRVAMPEAQIVATKISGMIVLSGTVLSPEDANQAEALVNGYVGNEPGSKIKKVLVLNRIKTATPQQVNLRVRIAEVSRSVSKSIGANLLNRDTAGAGGAVFGVSSGRAGAVSIGNANVSSFPVRDASSLYGLPAGSVSLPWNPATGQFVTSPGTSYNFASVAGQTLLGLGGRFLGMDVGAALDLAETDGEVTTLAEPNLTALSGETASFLAGGEIPIPIAQPSTGGVVSVSVEYKPYGVSLSFTPVVLADGRISLRVRPEVSELTSKGSVSLNGLVIPALTTRRSETTVELGSGQSMVISGLLQNENNSNTTKAPGLGDVPVLGTLFRSNSFQKGESELMIVVTPYLVKPVNANQIVLPTDGIKAPTDLQRVLLGKDSGGQTGGDRPKPSMAAPATRVTPSVGALDALPLAPKPAAPVPTAPEQVGAVTPQPQSAPVASRKPKRGSDADASPGFGS